MKVLTSRVIVSVMISVLMIAAAPAEDKVGGDLGDKTGGVDVPIKGGTRSVTDHQLFTSKAYVDQEIAELSSHKVNGQALSNENIYFYATETERSTAGMAIKTVLLSAGSLGSGITTIPTGMVLVVQPGRNATVAPTQLRLTWDGESNGITKSLRYNGAEITLDMAGTIWNTNNPSIWAFDGTYWNYVGGAVAADISSHKVNGAPLSKSASYFYGEGIGAESTETKTVSIPSITGTPAVGQVIVVKPATTNISSTIKINLNNTTAYSVLYRGSSSNIPKDVWTAYVPSIFVLDETSGGTKYWRYVGTSPAAMTWSATEATAVNAYSTTFDGTTNAWPVADENKYVKGDSLANALALKQNKIATDTVEKMLYSNEVELPALASYNFGNNDGLVANTVGILTDAINMNYTIDWDMALTDDWLESQSSLDDVVPTVKFLAREFRKMYWASGNGYSYTAAQLTNAINSYSTTFAGTDNNWPNQEALGNTETEVLVTADVFAHGLALKQNALPAQASGAPVTIPTYPTYGQSNGAIGKMYLDTSSLYTSNDTHFPSSKLLNTTLSLYVPKNDAYNTTNLNSDLSTNYNGAPLWATSNGVASLYRVPDAASGTNWAATALSTWSDGKIVPTMDTLARSLAGLYDAVGGSIDDRILNYSETGIDIGSASIAIPTQIAYTGDRFLDDGNQLFWLPQLAKDGDRVAELKLSTYAQEKVVPSMDELAYALDGLLQTRENTSEWQDVALYYGLRDLKDLHSIAELIEGEDRNAMLLNRSGYLQTFAPTLETLMNESYALYQDIYRKQNKLSGTDGNLVTYGRTAGTTGSKAIATSISNNANTVPNTQAVYNAVNARQNVIPVAGAYRSSNTATINTTISDWTATNIKGTALVTKPTSSDGVVGERKIFEVGDTYTNDDATNIQIATIGAVMENTVTKRCVGYKPDASVQNAASCWLWQITSNAELQQACSATGTSCSSNTECCTGSCKNGVCFEPPNFCGSAGASCGGAMVPCCDGLTCSSQTNICVFSQ